MKRHDREHQDHNWWHGRMTTCWGRETSWRGHPDLNQWPGHVQNSGEGWGSGQQCKICDGGNGWTSRRSGDGGGCCKCSWNSGDGMVVVVELEEDVVMVVWWWRWWSNGWWRVGGQNSCGGGIVGGGKGMNEPTRQWCCKGRLVMVDKERRGESFGTTRTK